MKITLELARASVKDSKSKLAVKASILIAVIMLGTLLFVYSELELGQLHYHQKLVGDFHAQLYGITFEEYEKLEKTPEIQILEPSQMLVIKGVPFQREVVELQLQSPSLLNTDFFAEVRSLEGKLPQDSTEILVSEIFILENPTYDLQSTIWLGSKFYKISGIYKDHLYSFDKNYNFFGQLALDDKEELFRATNYVDVTIWFKNERDTYSLMRQILKDLGRENEDILIKKGGLNYNTPYLEGKLIFKSGLIPSRGFFERWSLRIALLACIAPLFILMIYNAFNVWSSQDLRQIGLFKSSGMTPRQVHSFVQKKALGISLFPILLGIILAYGFTNLLFYLMWLNEKTSKAASQMSLSQFKLVTPNPFVFLILFLLAILCVLVATLRPAKRSSKLSIVDAMKGSQPKQKKFRKTSKYFGKSITYSLGKDNSISYKHTFRGMAIAMALAGMVFSTVLIVQSQRSLEDLYNKPDSAYNLTSFFFTVHKAPKKLLEDLKTIPNAERSYVFTSYSFRYLPSENQAFASPEFNLALQEKKRCQPVTAKVYGLEDSDFELLLRENNLDPNLHESYLLLNQTAQNPSLAYKHRSYIPLVKEETTKLVVRDEKDKEIHNLAIAGLIDEFPYDLYPLWPDQITLFTSMSKLEDFRVQYDKISEHYSLEYGIKMTADLEILPQVTEDLQTILHRYIPKSDSYTHNAISEVASQQEQTRNELLLTFAALILFMIIGLSNAYNSVHLNLQARTRDFALLRSAGMTEEQLRKMLGYEIFFLIRQVLIYYVLMLIFGSWIFAAKRKYMFSPWQLILKLNFPLLILFFTISIFGIWLAMESGRRKVLSQSIISTLRQHY